MQLTRKLLIMLGVAVALGFVLVGVALADEGPHGSYGAQTNGWYTTPACAGCHRMHTGRNTYLLISPEITSLCKNCHGPAGTGADTNVWDGLFQDRINSDGGYIASNSVTDPANWLNGGGFFSARNVVSTTLGAGASLASVTSRHQVVGLEATGNLDAVAWDWTSTAPGGYGAGNNPAGPSAVTAELQCTSCHDPHGSYNYRLLQQGQMEATELATWTENAAAFLTNNVYSDQVTPSTGAGGKPHVYTAGLNVAYDRGISDFCAACHTNYLLTRQNVGGTSGPGQLYAVPSMYGPDPVSIYRHSVSFKATWSGTAWDTTYGKYRSKTSNQPVYNGADIYDNTNATPASSKRVLRRVSLDQTATNGKYVTCLTCHFAHGSSAKKEGPADPANAGEVGFLTNGSANLFLDNRGICVQCHQGSFNLGNAPDASGYTTGGGTP